MSTIGSINIGIGASTAPLSRDLGRARGELKGFASETISLGSAAKLAAGAFAGFSAVSFLKDTVAAASDLNESISAIGSILGESAKPVIAYADDMAARFGLVKKEVIDAASGFGAIGQGLGELKGEELADFSKRFTQLAADLSSNQNLSLAEASSALRVQLSGEQSDKLKALGVVTTEETLKQYAYSHAIATAGAELSENEKIQARAAIIGAKLAFVNGDLERTAGGVANQLRGLGGRFTNFSAELGATLTPITNVFLGLAGDALSVLAPALVSAGQTISAGFIEVANTVVPGLQAIGDRLAEFPANFEKTFGAGTIGFLGQFGAALKADIVDTLDLVGFAWRNITDFMDIWAIQVNQVLTNAGIEFGTLLSNLGIIGNYVANNWRELIVDGVNAVVTVFQNLGTNLFELGRSIRAFFEDPTQGVQFNWTPLLDGFQATAAELPTLLAPELVSFQDQIDEKLKAIGEREAVRAQEIADAAAKVEPATPAKPAAAAAAEEEIAAKGKGKEKLNAAALELGSAEARAADIALRQGGTGDPMKDVAKTGRDSLAQQRKQTSLLDTLVKKDTALQVVNFT